MSRVESRPTHELWGMSEDGWNDMMDAEGYKEYMIGFYSDGIMYMERLNKEVLKEKSYGDIVGHKVGMDVMMAERNKTIDFYRLRLKELER